MSLSKEQIIEIKNYSSFVLESVGVVNSNTDKLNEIVNKITVDFIENGGMNREVKRLINKLIFAELSPNGLNQTKEIEPKLDEVNQEILNKMTENAKIAINGLIDKNNYNLNVFKTKRTSLFRELDNLNVEITKLNTFCTSLGHSKNKMYLAFRDKLLTIFKSGFWNISSEGLVIVFTNKTDVKIQRESIGEVNLGKFQVQYDISSSSLRIIPYDNNIYVNGFFHPHVHESGDICWGSHSSIANTLATSLEIAELMQLVANLLVDYNPENPYMPLEVFANKTKFNNIIKKYDYTDINNEILLKIFEDFKNASLTAEILDNLCSNACNESNYASNKFLQLIETSECDHDDYLFEHTNTNISLIAQYEAWRLGYLSNISMCFSVEDAYDAFGIHYENEDELNY